MERNESSSDTNLVPEYEETSFSQRRRCCSCFHLPCFDRSLSSSSSTNNNGSSPAVGSNWWQKRTAQIQNSAIWARGVNAVMKIREWSELVAGPRWKTFIRRFNRNRSGKHVNFQYDALSYAMNFDEGPGQDGNFEEGDGYYYGRNFSSRYAAVPDYSSKAGPAFV